MRASRVVARRAPVLGDRDLDPLHSSGPADRDGVRAPPFGIRPQIRVRPPQIFSSRVAAVSVRRFHAACGRLEAITPPASCPRHIDYSFAIRRRPLLRSAPMALIGLPFDVPTAERRRPRRAYSVAGCVERYARLLSLSRCELRVPPRSCARCRSRGTRDPLRAMRIEDYVVLPPAARASSESAVTKAGPRHFVIASTWPPARPA